MATNWEVALLGVVLVIVGVGLVFLGTTSFK
jgi:hypothetical protein